MNVLKLGCGFHCSGFLCCGACTLYFSGVVIVLIVIVLIVIVVVVTVIGIGIVVVVVVAVEKRLQLFQILGELPVGHAQSKPIPNHKERQRNAHRVVSSSA